MLISGNLLPPPPGSYNQSLSDNQQRLSDRNSDAEKNNRQQTVEYIFKGDYLEEAVYQYENSNPYFQSIDPANQVAISSYTENSSNLPRQGRLVDFFI